MLRYVYGHDDIVADFVAQLIPLVRGRGFPAKRRAIGVLDDEGKLIAGFVYYSWNTQAQTIEMAGAALPGARFFTRETLWRMFEYPLVQCDCQMLMMRVEAENDRLLAQLARGGFMFVTIPRLYGRGKDGVIAMLTREEWDSNPLYRFERAAKMKEAA